MKKYKINRKLIEVNCDQCGGSYEKPISEYNRNLKLNRRNFCSRVCVGKASHNFISRAVCYPIKNHANNRNDEYTPFRYLFRNIKQRFQKLNISLEDLKVVWELQGGKCVYSGVDLTLPTHTTKGADIRFTASVDRINSSLGYVKGNIQYTSIALNLMKSTMSDKETKELCNIIASFVK